MGNIKLTKILGLLCCLAGSSNAYAQAIENVWVGETWSQPNSGSYNYYLMEKGSKFFLKHESETTLDPNSATMFTICDYQHSSFSNPNSKYHVTYQLNNETMYVAEIKGSAIWGGYQSEGGVISGMFANYDFRWHFQNKGTEGNSKYYKIWNFDRKGGEGGWIDNNSDPRSILFVDNPAGGKTVAYIEKLGSTEEEHSLFYMISQAQYDALYPQRMIREQLGYDKIQCTGWYNPVTTAEVPNVTTDAYLADSTYTKNRKEVKQQWWLARVACPKTNGERLQLKISNLLDRPVDIELYVCGTINAGVTRYSYTTDLVNVYGADGVVTKNFKRKNKYTTGQDCMMPDSVLFENITPKNGVIEIKLKATGDYSFAAIKSIKYHEPSFVQNAASLTDGSYYIYNVGTGKYLDAGGTWDSQAVIGHGQEFVVNKLANGKYTLQSCLSPAGGAGNGYYYGRDMTSNDKVANGYESVNGETPAELTIAGLGNEMFSLSMVRRNFYREWEIYHYVDKQNDVNFFMSANASTGTVGNTVPDAVSADNARWKFQTKQQRIDDLVLARIDAPKDATFLIADPQFGGYNNRFGEWHISDEAASTIGIWSTPEKGMYDNKLHLKSASYDVWQTLTGVPNGLYKLTVNGCHNDDYQLNPVVEIYANDNVSPIANLSSGNQVWNPETAEERFKAGSYKSQILFIVEDGTINLGARSFAMFGGSYLDNFELTYYGAYDPNDVGDADMFIKNNGFAHSTWDEYWNGSGVSKGTANNTSFEGSGYYAEATATANNSLSAGYIQQNVSLSPGYYSLSARCVAHNNPGFLYARIGGREQHIVFIDTISAQAAETNKANITHHDRELRFILTETTNVTVGYRFPSSGSINSFRWNAVDNFHLKYLGKIKDADITCQIQNRDFIKNNEGLASPAYGWKTDGNNQEGKSAKVFSYDDFHDRTHGVAQLYNGPENLRQTITGLPDGWYEVQVQGFYRDCNAELKNSKDRKGAFLYANNASVPMCLITSEPSYDFPATSNGKELNPSTGYPGNPSAKYPRDLEMASMMFANPNAYNNTLKVRVTNGELQIGIRRPKEISIDGADWTVLNNVKLKYLHNDSELPEDEELTQYIMNPSFESKTKVGWTVTSKTTFPDNANNALMQNVAPRYIANTGDINNPKLSYYYLEQEIGGVAGTNGLPQGDYTLKAKVVSSVNNVVTINANGRRGDYIISSTTDPREIELGNVGINDNERFKISFTSSYPFSIDEVRLVRGTHEDGYGDAIKVDLDGLINKADTILKSGFIGNGAFQIDGTRLQTAMDAAISINANDQTPYPNRKAAKEELQAAIEAIQTAPVNAPDESKDYMIAHVSTQYYMSTTNDAKVVINTQPAKIRFKADGTGYIISDHANNDAKIDTGEADKPLKTDDTGVRTYFRIVFMNGIPSHIAISTDENFTDGKCYGTGENTMNYAPVYGNTDMYDGNSHWFISLWEEPSIKEGENIYLYNIAAGAFLGHEDVNQLMGWQSKGIVDGREDIPWSVKEVTGGVQFTQNVTDYENRGKHLYIKNDDSYRKYGIGLWVDGLESQKNEHANIFAFNQDSETGYYTIGIEPGDDDFGVTKIGTQSYIGWSGESNLRTIIPLIPVGDKEPRGTRWIACTQAQYDRFKITTKAARSARMNAWPVLRSALRSGIEASAFESVYYNPLATSEEINNALTRLKSIIASKALRATEKTDGFVDYSFYDGDLDCQNYTSTIHDYAEGDSWHERNGQILNENGWTSNGAQCQYDLYMMHTNDMVFGTVFYEMWNNTALGERSLTREINGLPEGYYTLAVDFQASTVNAEDNLTGVEFFISQDENKKSHGITNKGLSTVVIPDTIAIYNGKTTSIGIQTSSTTNASWLAVDNFKLRYCGPLRDHKVKTENNQKEVIFTGTWRDTENDEINDIITNEGKGITIEMEDATILDPIDITLTTPDNVLVYAGEDDEITINGVDKNIIKGGHCKEFEVIDLVTLNIIKPFKAHKIYYNRNMNGWSYASLVLPYALHTNSDVQLYRLVEGDGNGRFYIERISDNEAGVPMLMRKKDSEATKITINEVSVEGIDVVTTTEIPLVMSTDGKLKLIGSYIYDTVIGNKNYKTDDPDMVGKWANNYYYFKNDKFVRGKDYFYCDAFRTYIDVTQAPSQVRSRTEFELSEWEETNGIDSNESDTYIEVDEVYNTNGIQKQGISKGINIVKMSNGQIKKIFVK